MTGQIKDGGQAGDLWMVVDRMIVDAWKLGGCEKSLDMLAMRKRYDEAKLRVAYEQGNDRGQRLCAAIVADALGVVHVAAEPAQPDDSGRAGGGFKFDDDDVRLALGYSRNYAHARPDTPPTVKEHIMGLCDRLESLLEDRAALAEQGPPAPLAGVPDGWRETFVNLLEDYAGARGETAAWNVTQRVQPEGGVRLPRPRLAKLMAHVDLLATREAKS